MVVADSHSLVLVSLADKHWSGQWRLSREQKLELFRQIEADAEGRGGRSGSLTKDDIHAFASNERHREMVLELPGAAHGLLNNALVGEVLSAVDGDRSASLDRAEWDSFLERLEAFHLRYLLKRSFQNFQAFYGRGQPWLSSKGLRGMSSKDLRAAAGKAWVADGTARGEVAEMVGLAEEGTALKEGGEGLAPPRKRLPLFQAGVDPDSTGTRLPPGWWEDLYYYSSNNHPLHGILAADQRHRLSRKERLAMEMATISFLLMTLRLHLLWVDAGAAPLAMLANDSVFGLLVVTLPGMGIWWSLFLLFTCPCAFVDKSQVEWAQAKRLHRRSQLAGRVGYALVALGIAGLLWHAARVAVDGSRLGRVSIVLRGRLRSYVITWVVQALVYFNPWISWGQPDPSAPLCLGDYIGLGQWRVEKQRFQHRCLDALSRLDGELESAGGSSGEDAAKMLRRRC
eukprot:TRINITY_DN970_c2_g1_i1.p1 TRINITY_DN970_c2_g1~~TRINITY_DN970_c2_g1_i1.p1  ORF type:complete len:456 (-),score=94.13 TRINITY_DN970_c2_g1_i1:70-1437(-)